MINKNLEIVRQNIEIAARKAGRNPKDARLICVTKEANSSQILDALSQGVTELGENRVKDAVLKHQAIADKATWHLIGHLQTNKVKDAVRMFTLIHSVDSLRLAQYIDKEARKLGKVQEVLIEVNVSGEKAKFGISPDGLGKMLESIKDLSNIKVKGLMTVTPLTDNPQNSKPHFKSLKELRDRYSLKELSMGMTQDYEVAVEEGATMVRIGRAIFKENVNDK